MPYVPSSSLVIWRLFSVVLSLLMPAKPNPTRSSMRPELDNPIELERDYIAHCYSLPSHEH